MTRASDGVDLRAAPDVPGVPSAEELSALPHGELAARLAESYTLIGELTVQAGRLQARGGGA